MICIFEGYTTMVLNPSFEHVSNLKVLNVTFKGCGTLSANGKHLSAVHIFNSINIHFEETKFQMSHGRGLSMFGTFGSIEVKQSSFIENSLSNEAAEGSDGGGVLIAVSPCAPAPGPTTCSSTITIKGCIFKGNMAPWIKRQQLIGGGGIRIFFHRYSQHNSIVVHNCMFYNNSAQHGGGVYLLFGEDAHDNNVSISECSFVENRGLISAGTVAVAHITSKTNKIVIKNTDFMLFRGAINMIVTLFEENEGLDIIHFINCTWVNNSAFAGAAIITKHLAGQHLLSVVIIQFFAFAILYSQQTIQQNKIYSLEL